MVKWGVPQQVEVNEVMKKEAVAKALNCLYEFENGSFKNPVKNDAKMFLAEDYANLYNEILGLVASSVGEDENNIPVKMIKFKPSNIAFVDMLVMKKKNNACKQFSFKENGEKLKVCKVDSEKLNMNDYSPFCME